MIERSRVAAHPLVQKVLQEDSSRAQRLLEHRQGQVAQARARYREEAPGQLAKPVRKKGRPVSVKEIPDTTVETLIGKREEQLSQVTEKTSPEREAALRHDRDELLAERARRLGIEASVSIDSHLASMGDRVPGDRSVRITTDSPQVNPHIEEANPRQSSKVPMMVETRDGARFFVNPQGNTTRDDAGRAESSQRTFSVAPADARKLALLLRSEEGGPKRATVLADGRLALQYVSGPKQGRIVPRSAVQVSPRLSVGAMPIKSSVGTGQTSARSELIWTASVEPLGIYEGRRIAVSKAFDPVIAHFNRKQSGIVNGADSVAPNTPPSSPRHLILRQSTFDPWQPSYGERYQSHLRGLSPQEFAQAIQGLDYEVVAVFDEDDNMVFDPKRGSRSQVEFTEREVELAKGKRIIHNHPDGLGFSGADIKAAYQSAATIIAVGPPPQGIWYEIDGKTFGKPHESAKKVEARVEQIARAMDNSEAALREENKRRRDSGMAALKNPEAANFVWEIQKGILENFGVTFRRSSLWQEW